MEESGPADLVPRRLGKFFCRPIPAIYGLRRFASAGGLMIYGTNDADAGYLAGLYTACILKGERPSHQGVWYCLSHPAPRDSNDEL